MTFGKMRRDGGTAVAIVRVNSTTQLKSYLARHCPAPFSFSRLHDSAKSCVNQSIEDVKKTKQKLAAAADRHVQSRQTNDSWQRLAVECTLEGEELMFVFITARYRLPPSDPVTFPNNTTRRGWKQFSGENLQHACQRYSLFSPPPEFSPLPPVDTHPA